MKEYVLCVLTDDLSFFSLTDKENFISAISLLLSPS